METLSNFAFNLILRRYTKGTRRVSIRFAGPQGRAIPRP
jgi:hypothetical protein